MPANLSIETDAIHAALAGHVAAVAMIAILFGRGPAFAQSGDTAKTYPSRPVRVVNPSSPGGGGDIMGRLIAQQLTKSLGQNFIIDNRPGAANIIATEIVAKSPPAGTPRDIVAKLHGEIVAALKLVAIQRRITDLGAEVIGNTPQEFSAQIMRERAKWEGVVKEAGIKP